MSSFYLTLTSSTVRANTASDFTVLLPQQIALGPDMEVALVHLQCPTSIHTVPKGEDFVLFNNTMYSVPSGNYSSIYVLLQKLRSIVPKDVVFTNDTVENSCTIELKTSSMLRIPQSLSRVLGFDNAVDITGPSTTKSTLECGILGNNMSVFVYTDLVRCQMVDGTNVPLLALTSAESVTGGKFYAPAVPIYRDVSRTTFDNINIELLNVKGHKIPFSSGITLIQLHFRKKHTV